MRKRNLNKIYNYFQTKCICGHSVFIIPEKEYLICSWCKRKIKNNTKGHFIYKMQKLLKGDKNGK